jgi:hypothetical protein
MKVRFQLSILIFSVLLFDSSLALLMKFMKQYGCSKDKETVLKSKIKLDFCSFVKMFLACILLITPSGFCLIVK